MPADCLFISAECTVLYVGECAAGQTFFCSKICIVLNIASVWCAELQELAGYHCHFGYG